MPNYKIIIEYDGTELAGWQKQPCQQTAQTLLEDAIFSLSQEKVDITAAGRTDAGVHAIGQVANFKLEKDFDLYSLRQGINFYMANKPVAVVDAEKVSDDFSARFSAKKRYYKYIILNRSSVPVLERNRVWHIAADLDLSKMKAAAKHLIGKHDFTSFRSSDCQAKNPVRTLDEIRIEREGEHIYLYFSALSFLHHQIRNITGTLAQVAMGKILPDEIKNILAAKDRTKAGVQAPAAGLYFVKVDY